MSASSSSDVRLTLSYDVTGGTNLRQVSCVQNDRFRYPVLAVSIPASYFDFDASIPQIKESRTDGKAHAYRCILSMFAAFSEWLASPKRPAPKKKKKKKKRRRFRGRGGGAFVMDDDSDSDCDNGDDDYAERGGLRWDDEDGGEDANDRAPNQKVVFEAACGISPIADADNRPDPNDVKSVRIRIFYRDLGRYSHGSDPSQRDDILFSDPNDEKRDIRTDCLKWFLAHHFDKCKQQDERLVSSSYYNNRTKQTTMARQSAWDTIRKPSQLRTICELYAPTAGRVTASTGSTTLPNLLEVFSEGNCVRMNTKGVCQEQTLLANYQNNGDWGVFPVPARVYQIKGSLRSSSFFDTFFPWCEREFVSSDPTAGLASEYLQGMTLDWQADYVVEQRLRNGEIKAGEEDVTKKKVFEEISECYKGLRTELAKRGEVTVLGILRDIQQKTIAPNARIKTQMKRTNNFRVLGERAEKLLHRKFSLCDQRKQLRIEELKMGTGHMTREEIEADCQKERAEGIREIRAEQTEEFIKIWCNDDVTINPSVDSIRIFTSDMFKRRKDKFCFPRKRMCVDISPFADRVTAALHELEVSSKFAFTHDIAFMTFISAMHVYSEFNSQLHTLLSGPPGTGKSYAIDNLIKTLIPGTWQKTSTESLKSNSTDTVLDDTIEANEEVPSWYISLQKGKGSEMIERLKNEMTSGQSNNKAWNRDEETGKITSKLTEGKCRTVKLWGSNLPLAAVDAALRDRLIRVFVPGRPGEQSRIMDQADKSTNGDHYGCYKSSTIDKWRRDQAIVCILQKMIISGALPEPNIRIGEDLFRMALKKGPQRGLSDTNNQRNYERLTNTLRTLVLYSAVDRFFDLHPTKAVKDAELQEDVIRELKNIAPYLYATKEMAFFTFETLAFQYEDAAKSLIRSSLKSFWCTPKPVYPNGVQDGDVADVKRPGCMVLNLTTITGFSPQFRIDKDDDRDVLWGALSRTIMNTSGRHGFSDKDLTYALRSLYDATEIVHNKDGTIKSGKAIQLETRLVNITVEGQKTVSQNCVYLIVLKSWLETASSELALKPEGYCAGQRIVLSLIRNALSEPCSLMGGVRVSGVSCAWQVHEIKPLGKARWLRVQSNSLSETQKFFSARLLGQNDPDDYDPKRGDLVDTRKLVSTQVMELNPGEDLDVCYARCFHIVIGWDGLALLKEHGVQYADPAFEKAYWENVFADINNEQTPKMKDQDGKIFKVRYEDHVDSIVENNKARDERSKQALESPVKAIRPPKPIPSIQAPPSHGVIHHENSLQSPDSMSYDSPIERKTGNHSPPRLPAPDHPAQIALPSASSSSSTSLSVIVATTSTAAAAVDGCGGGSSVSGANQRLSYSPTSLSIQRSKQAARAAMIEAAIVQNEKEPETEDAIRDADIAAAEREATEFYPVQPAPLPPYRERDVIITESSISNPPSQFTTTTSTAEGGSGSGGKHKSQKKTATSKRQSSFFLQSGSGGDVQQPKKKKPRISPNQHKRNGHSVLEQMDIARSVPGQ